MDPNAPLTASQEDQLAAIQKAMNDLKDQVQGCWAAAATERFDIEGDLRLRIEISPARSAQAMPVRDTIGNAKLAGCVVGLISAYPWAPPLAGQTIELPFRFRAPDGQNTIDRRYVEWHTQGKLSVAVLLDDNNTGSDAASMFELAIAAGASTGLRIADRDQLWYFLAAGEAKTLRPLAPHAPRASRATVAHAVATGDLVYLPRGSAIDVAATSGDLHAMVAMVPGGREGAARAGALPNRELADGDIAAAAAVQPKFISAGAAAVDAPIQLGSSLEALAVTLPAHSNIADHVHAEQAELLYLTAGSGTLTVAGTALPLTPTSVVQVPGRIHHSLAVDSEIRMLLIHAPRVPRASSAQPSHSR